MLVISVILAAGRGTRMGSYKNKTTLSLFPEETGYEYPIILEILKNLPLGKRIIVVNYRKEDILRVTSKLDVTYCIQPVLNGTGGAVISASELIKETEMDYVLITVGDAPFVKRQTYLKLIDKLKEDDLVVLGFSSEDKRQYGILEIEKNAVKRIIEWKVWKDLSIKEECLCNAGIYAVKKEILLRYIPVLSSRPHTVEKRINGRLRKIKEYFFTDIVEYMNKDGLKVGYVIAEKDEAMGIDDPDSLSYARKIFISKRI